MFQTTIVEKIKTHILGEITFFKETCHLYDEFENKKHGRDGQDTDDSILYILECNPHPYYSYRGLKNQTRIRFAVESWILEKNDRAAVRAVRTIQ